MRARTMRAECKFETAEECVTRLREYAVQLSKEYQEQERVRHSRKLDTKLNAVCTCIELLTVHGNYYRERIEAGG